MQRLKSWLLPFALGLLTGFSLSVGYVYQAVSSRIEAELQTIERGIK